jgi:hypothetical protein
MALSDCEKCWEHYCICGHDYRDWPADRLKELIGVLIRVLEKKEKAP